VPMIALRDTELFYEYAPGPMTTVVFLHGGVSSSTTDWTVISPILQNYGYGTLTFDARGHGKSRPWLGPVSTRCAVQDFRAVLVGLEVPTFALVAFSHGCLTAFRFAQAWPKEVRCAVLIGFAPRYSYVAIEQMRADSSVRWRKWASSIHDESHGSGHWRRLLDDLAADRRTRYGRISDTDLTGFNTPTLLVTGDRDPYSPLVQTLRTFQAMPHADLAVLPNSGHPAHGNHPDTFGSLVANFIERNGSTG
jgi:pimeloyl-ACP methyl ester carboxylesterase